MLDRHRDLPRYLLTAILPAILFSLVVAGALVLASGPTSRLLTDGSASAAAFQNTLVAIAPWVPVAVVYAITMSASRGLGSVRPLVLVEKIGRNLLETVSAGVAAAVTTSIALIVTAWVAPYAAMLIVVAVWVLRRTKRMLANSAERSADPTPWRPLASEFWRFSAPRAVSRVCTVALQRFDILVVAAIRGPADAAVYAAATRFLVLGLMFVQAIQQVMAPKISECLALGEDRRAEAIYRTTTDVAHARVLADLPPGDALRPPADVDLRPAVRAGRHGGGDPVRCDAGGDCVRTGRLDAAHGRPQRAEPDQHRAGAGHERRPGPGPRARARCHGRRSGLGRRHLRQQPAAAL